jgi:hypothetical protein
MDRFWSNKYLWAHYKNHFDPILFDNLALLRRWLQAKLFIIIIWSIGVANSLHEHLQKVTIVTGNFMVQNETI